MILVRVIGLLGTGLLMVLAYFAQQEISMNHETHDAVISLSQLPPRVSKLEDNEVNWATHDEVNRYLAARHEPTNGTPHER